MPIRTTFLLDQLAQGGAEKHAVMLANTVDRARFSVGLAYLKPDHTLLPLVQRDLMNSVECLGIGRWLDLAAVRRFGNNRKREGTDVVVAANPYATLYAVLARRLTRAPYSVIATYHTTLLQRWTEKLQMPVYKRALQSADALVFMSKYQRSYWQKRGMKAPRESIIYNGVDTNYFSPTATLPPAALPQGWLPGRDYIVGICAGLRPEKSHVDLIEAVARLAAQGVPIRCLLVGDGAERQAIESLVAERGLADRVFITGFMGDVRPYLRLCDVMVLASRTETFSLASLESMAMGLPMIMSDVGGAREQITPGETGLVFPHGDVASLASCLTQLVPATVRRAMGDRAMRSVREHFSFGRMIQQYEQLLEDVAAACPQAVRAMAL